MKKRKENLKKKKAEVEALRKKVELLEKQTIARKLEKSAQQVQAKQRQESMASLQGLPTELQTHIFAFLAQPALLDIQELAKKLLALAGTSKALYAAINNPTNMIAIFTALPYYANVKDLAEHLRKKPVTMPVMQTEEIKNWLATIRLVRGQELFYAVRRNDINAVRYLLSLKNIDLNWISEHGCTAIAMAHAMQQNIHAQNASTIYYWLLKAGANPHLGTRRAPCTIL